MANFKEQRTKEVTEEAKNKFGIIFGLPIEKDITESI